MALLNLSSAQLAQLIGLIKEKESLQAKIEKVDAALTALESGNATPARRGRKPGRPSGKRGPGRPPGKRGPGRPPKSVVAVKAGPGRPAGKSGKRGKRLKTPLLKALKSAGASGITVGDLANKLGVKRNNIFSWFYTTGKKVKGITKVGEAKYAYAG